MQNELINFYKPFCESLLLLTTMHYYLFKGVLGVVVILLPHWPLLSE